MCLCGGEQGRLRYTQTFRQQQRRYFVKCVAVTAVIFLITSTCAAQATMADQSEMPWAQELQKYPGLLPEFGQLLDKLQHNIQFPQARSQSRLLPLLPESTMFYGALPNYGDVAHQALTIFRQELQESSVLRDWWQHGEMAAAGPKVEDSLEKFYELSQYLGDEIVMSGATEGPDHSLMICQRTGFADMKYLVWERKAVTGHTLSEGELSFTGPRRGVASWLAAPAPMGSLDFVSPKAILASTVLLKNLGEIFEDFKDLSSASNPSALAMLAQMEAAMQLSLKDDLLSQLRREITLELDSVYQRH